MISPTARPVPQQPIIEPLEQRIAPALLIAGANLLGGHGNPTTAETSIGGHSVTVVKVLSGNAIVWFDGNFISGISVGPNTSLDITGDVNGDIVANLTASGHLTDSDGNATNGADGDVLLANNIVGITTHPLAGGQPGSIGDIITGGTISNLNISGNLSGAFAGDGVFRAAASPLPGSHALSGGVVSVDVGVDTNPVQAGIQPSFFFLPSNAKTLLSGASISNLNIAAAKQLQVFAGDGFAGAKGKPGLPGGSVTNIVIKSSFSDPTSGDATGYDLRGGNGGAGTSGGAGGSITKVLEASSTGSINILGGAGGTGLTAAGGAGGSLKGLDMQSDSSSYNVHAGKGGAGAPGGAGGMVSDVNFAGNSPTTGLIVHGNFTGNASGAEDVVIIDSGTGNMVLEQNVNGDGSAFTPVVQEYTNGVAVTTIPAQGVTPVAAVAADVNGDGLLDLVVAYKNSNNLTVYLNQGGGSFYLAQSGTGGISYSLVTKSTTLPDSPSQLAVGNFTGDNSLDAAVLSTTVDGSTLDVAQGDGSGSFGVLNYSSTLPGSSVGLLAAPIHGQGGYSDLFAAFKSGAIYPLLANGSTTAAPFTVQPGVVTVPGGISNIDINPQAGQLLALNGSGTALDLYTYDTSGLLTSQASPQIAQQPGHPLVAHFVPDLASPEEPIQVLSTITGGSRLDTYSLASSAYSVTSSVVSTDSLKNFAPVLYDADGITYGDAALGGSLGHFSFTQSDKVFYNVGLPFSGKTVSIAAGDGGAGQDAAHALARGGAGGSIIGINAVADDAIIRAGLGGSSGNGAAGQGGSISNPALLATAGGTVLAPAISADLSLTVYAGSGGSATGSVASATGGAGGSVSGLSLTLASESSNPPVLQVFSGTGGTGGGGAGGFGGSITSLKTTALGTDLSLTAGGGGSAQGAVGNGGAGGSISKITDQLTLDTVTQLLEVPYRVTLTAGQGGSSVGGLGGAGGSASTVSMVLQPSNESVENPFPPKTAHHVTDSTIRVLIAAGNAGDGATGGLGGSVSKISSTSIFNQRILVGNDQFQVETNPVTAQFTSGKGGNGSKGAGGAGGSISTLSLSGLTRFDPDITPVQDALVILSGAGGNGATTGGAGGAITGLASFNAPFSDGASIASTQLGSASIISGAGGHGGSSSGGNGGLISGLNIGVEGSFALSVVSPPNALSYTLGQLTIQSGAGGAGGVGGKGGAGGNIASSLLGSSNSLGDYGLLLRAGSGGPGGIGGGSGGSVTGIQLNAPENPGSFTSGYDAIASMILAGNGGAATTSGTGGTGGGISGISETKDVNSTINLIQAGNGGASVATGGLGGSISNIQTVGLIGQASDGVQQFGVFDTGVDPSLFATAFPHGIPQGLFAGRGGTGATAGLAGSVTSVSAAQIAAIGAAVDANGLFAAAQKVAGITAQSIAFDLNGNGHYNNQIGSTDNPGASVALDGFIFSHTTPVGVVTSNPNLANFTFVA